MSLADYVRILGRGPGRSRSLTQSEAHAAMLLMLQKDAAPEAIGALLMLLRMKGETAQEIAGFASAAQAEVRALPQIDLDWPSYAAGRSRGAPWFLTSAKLVAEAGHRVLIHGWNGVDTKVRAGLSEAGIGIASTLDEVDDLIRRDRIAYLPLETAHPTLFRLLSLRGVLGLRSCVNTVCRMLNPARASASVQGVFHPSYRLLQADAAALLGWQNLTVIKGGGGEFERHPAKDVAGFGLRGGVAWEGGFAAAGQDQRRLHEIKDGYDLKRPDEFDLRIILGTAAAALATLRIPQPEVEAKCLWSALAGHQAA